MTASEIIEAIEELSYNADDIFRIYKEACKMSFPEKDKLVNSGYAEMLVMMHSAAIEMKKKGTWDSYVEKCKNKKRKTQEEIKKELMEKYF